MKHSSRRSTVSRAPDFHRPTGTACCPESFRRLVLSRSQLAKQSRPCALTSAFLGIDVEAHLRRHILTLGLLCFPLCNLLAQSANAIPPIATACLRHHHSIPLRTDAGCSFPGCSCLILCYLLRSYENAFASACGLNRHALHHYGH